MTQGFMLFYRRCRAIILLFFFISATTPALGLENCRLPAQTSNLHNCFGSYTWEDGNKYVGEWQLGMMHGKGTYTYPKKYKYVGEWRKAKIDGYGTHTWANGTKYVGMWENGKANGRGVLTKPNGKSFEGIWKKGKLILREKRTVYEAGLIPSTPFSLNNLSPSDD